MRRATRLAAAALCALLLAALLAPADPPRVSAVSLAARVEAPAAGPSGMIDGPAHHFGFTAANVLAQPTPPFVSKRIVNVNGVTLPFSVTGAGVAPGQLVVFDLFVDLFPSSTQVVEIFSNDLQLVFGPNCSPGVPDTVTVPTGNTGYTCRVPQPSLQPFTLVFRVSSTALVGSTLTNQACIERSDGSKDFTFCTRDTLTVLPPPPPGPPASQQAIEQAQSTPGFVRGQAGQPCASAPGQTCAGIGGGLSARGTIASSMLWTLMATLPATPAAGAGTPIAVFTTTSGVEGVPCLPEPPAAAPGAQITCTATTVGNALQGSAVALVFPGLAGAPGPLVGPAIVTGPGVAAAAAAPPARVAQSLLPPPPPILLPPPPSPLVPVAAPPRAEVPIIPEAEPLVLVLGGLTLLGLLANRRGKRRP